MALTLAATLPAASRNPSSKVLARGLAESSCLRVRSVSRAVSRPPRADPTSGSGYTCYALTRRPGPCQRQRRLSLCWTRRLVAIWSARGAGGASSPRPRLSRSSPSGGGFCGRRQLKQKRPSGSTSASQPVVGHRTRPEGGRSLCDRWLRGLAPVSLAASSRARCLGFAVWVGRSAHPDWGFRSIRFAASASKCGRSLCDRSRREM